MLTVYINKAPSAKTVTYLSQNAKYKLTFSFPPIVLSLIHTVEKCNPYEYGSHDIPSSIQTIIFPSFVVIRP
jgi:hypothetical protein